ncbi:MULTISPECIES: hypothetical protein [unclassified Pedobacter]|uniref:hypothetical protein n=1 Tax=unclassified Pedobacter TaxID=2628915 RepID=UPI00142427B7|nr:MULTISPECIES: hypothetical protein [unclassified Pedobacter]NMN37472.1 hypothetical protein [Pedobacter sp. SG918]
MIDFEKSYIRISLVSLVLCFAHTAAGIAHKAGIRFAKVYVNWVCATIEGLKPIAYFIVRHSELVSESLMPLDLLKLIA